MPEQSAQHKKQSSPKAELGIHELALYGQDVAVQPNIQSQVIESA